MVSWLDWQVTQWDPKGLWPWSTILQWAVLHCNLLVNAGHFTWDSLCASENLKNIMFHVFSSHSSCYGTVSSLNGEPEQGVAVEAVGQSDCSIYGEDTVTDEEGKFRLRGLLVRLWACFIRGFFIQCLKISCSTPKIARIGPGQRAGEEGMDLEPSQVFSFYLWTTWHIGLGFCIKVNLETHGFGIELGVLPRIEWLWHRPGLSNQRPVGPIERCKCWRRLSVE